MNEVTSNKLVKWSEDWLLHKGRSSNLRENQLVNTPFSWSCVVYQKAFGITLKTSLFVETFEHIIWTKQNSLNFYASDVRNKFAIH